MRRTRGSKEVSSGYYLKTLVYRAEKTRNEFVEPERSSGREPLAIEIRRERRNRVVVARLRVLPDKVRTVNHRFVTEISGTVIAILRGRPRARVCLTAVEAPGAGSPPEPGPVPRSNPSP